MTDSEAEARAYERRVFDELGDHAGVANMLRTMGIESRGARRARRRRQRALHRRLGGVPLHGTAEHIAQKLFFYG